MYLRGEGEGGVRLTHVLLRGEEWVKVDMYLRGEGSGGEG